MLQEGQEILEGRFKIIKKLGSGAFGEIFKGKSKSTPPNSSHSPFPSPLTLVFIPAQLRRRRLEKCLLPKL